MKIHLEMKPRNGRISMSNRVVKLFYSQLVLTVVRPMFDMAAMSNDESDISTILHANEYLLMLIIMTV